MGTGTYSVVFECILVISNALRYPSVLNVHPGKAKICFIQVFKLKICLLLTKSLRFQKAEKESIEEFGTEQSRRQELRKGGFSACCKYSTGRQFSVASRKREQRKGRVVDPAGRVKMLEKRGELQLLSVFHLSPAHVRCHLKPKNFPPPLLLLRLPSLRVFATLQPSLPYLCP